VRRFLVVLVASLVALGSTVAGAAWSPGGTGSGQSTSLAVGLPTSVSANAVNSSTVQITWAAPGGSSASPTQYVVRRTLPSTSTVCTVSGVTATCVDTGLTASTTYSYTVEARVGTSWSSGQTAAVNATTPAPPTLNVALAVAGNKTAGTAFNVTLTATTNGTTTDTAYTGVKAINFSGPSNAPSGTAPTYPATVTFASGVGTASITLRAAQTTTLAATDGTISGSTSVTVVAGTASQLKYSSSSSDCSSGSVTVGNRGSFTTKVTAYDAWLNPKSGTARSVALTRSPARGSWSSTPLSILAANSETTTSSTYTRAPGNTNVTVTAATTGLTSATCIVKR
jgi:beta-galactosidase